MVRKLIKLAVALVVLLIIGVLVALYFVDRIARTGIEKGATHALGVDTTLGKADVKVLAGEFEMAQLRVANPQGYKTDHFMTLNEGGVSVKLPSLLEETVELPTLTLTGIDLNMEKREGKANYDVILQNLKRFESTEPAEPAPGQKKFVIRQIDIRDVVVHVELLPIGGEISRTDVTIPEITLKDIGTESNHGVVMAEMTDIVIKAIFAAVLSKAGQLPGDIGAELGKGLAGLGDVGAFGITVAGETIATVGKTAEEVMKGAGEVIKGAGQAGEDITKGVDEAIKGVGGILGGKKDEDK